MERKFLTFSKFANFPEVVQAISSRHYGDMSFGNLEESEVRKNREHFLGQLNIPISDVIVPALAHCDQIAMVGNQEKGRGSIDKNTAITATDGLITDKQNVYLMVTIADCLAISIYDPMLKIVGIFHAGWRGIIAQIVPQAIKKFQSMGSETANLVVGVGPGICQKHFVVRSDVLPLFLAQYPAAVLTRNNHGYIDLKKAVFLDLSLAGVLEGNIEISSICPVCDNGHYGSYRKEKDNAPASAAMIGMR